MSSMNRLILVYDIGWFADGYGPLTPRSLLLIYLGKSVSSKLLDFHNACTCNTVVLVWRWHHIVQVRYSIHNLNIFLMVNYGLLSMEHERARTITLSDRPEFKIPLGVNRKNYLYDLIMKRKTCREKKNWISASRICIGKALEDIGKRNTKMYWTLITLLTSWYRQY